MRTCRKCGRLYETHSMFEEDMCPDCNEKVLDNHMNKLQDDAIYLEQCIYEDVCMESKMVDTGNCKYCSGYQTRPR